MSRIRWSAAAAAFIASLALTGCAGSSGGSSIDPVGTWGDTSDTTPISLLTGQDTVQVRYLKIIERSGYQALPWVRYITQSGDYQIRI